MRSLLWKSVFIHIEIGANCHNKNYALRLALKERLMGTRKWPIRNVKSKGKLILLQDCTICSFTSQRTSKECVTMKNARPRVQKLSFLLINHADLWRPLRRCRRYCSSSVLKVIIWIRTKYSPPNIFNAQATDENNYAGIISVTSDYLFI